MLGIICTIFFILFGIIFYLIACNINHIIDFKEHNLLKENMKNKFPKYYKSDLCGNIYKVTNIDYINIELNKILCYGIVVDYWNKEVKLDQTFIIPTYAKEVSEEEFTRIYNKVLNKESNGEFPQYFHNIKDRAYYKLVGKDGCLYHTVAVYYDSLVINGDGMLMPWRLQDSTCIPCSKDEYENVLNTIINKIK